MQPESRQNELQSMEQFDQVDPVNSDSVTDSSSAAPLNFKYFIPSPDSPTGFKTAIMTWPTDAQWVQRQRMRKVVIQQLGRGQQDTTQLSSDLVSLSIYNENRVEGSEDLTADEAELFLDNLSNTLITDLTRTGNEYSIALQAPNGTFDFTFRVPYVREMKNYEAAKVKPGPSLHGRQAFEVRLEPAAELFARLATAPYPGISIIHKSAAIEALIEDIKGTVEGRELPAPAPDSTNLSPRSFT